MMKFTKRNLLWMFFLIISLPWSLYRLSTMDIIDVKEENFESLSDGSYDPKDIIPSNEYAIKDNYTFEKLGNITLEWEGNDIYISGDLSAYMSNTTALKYSFDALKFSNIKLEAYEKGNYTIWVNFSEGMFLSIIKGSWISEGLKINTFMFGMYDGQKLKDEIDYNSSIQVNRALKNGSYKYEYAGFFDTGFMGHD